MNAPPVPEHEAVQRDVLHRVAARVLLLDGEGRVLLLRGGDPADPAAGTWWFTVGGGLDEGESPAEGAARELREETGLLAEPGELGEVVHQEETRFRWGGRDVVQQQSFFVLRTAAFEPDLSGLEQLEAASIVDHRWWTTDELAATADRVYPTGLLDLLAGL